MSKSNVGKRKLLVSKWWRCKTGFKEFEFQTEEDVARPVGDQIRMKASASKDGEVEWHEASHEHDDHDKLRWLTLNVESSIDFPFESIEWYKPLECRGLHREFAALQCNVSSILGFANEYGFLGRMTSQVYVNDGREDFVLAEGFSYWLGQVARMKFLLKLWDLYKLNDLEASEQLSSLIYFEEDEVLAFDHAIAFEGVTDDIERSRGPWPEGSLEGMDYDPELNWYVDASHIPPGLDKHNRIREAARLLVEAAVTSSLQEGSKPAIDVGAISHIRLLPIDLLGTIYVRFALEMSGLSEPPIRCLECAKWFGPKDPRRMFCSNKCKQKAYRRNRKTGSKDA